MIFVQISIILLVLLQFCDGQENLPNCSVNFYIRRKQWDAAKASLVEYQVTPVLYVIVHHTATQECIDIRSCKAMIKSTQSYHLHDLDYGDIGYK